MWEIYAYQNADSLFGVFNAAAAIHASGDYAAALAAVAFCGFVAALIAYAFAPEKLQGWKWLGTVVLVFLGVDRTQGHRGHCRQDRRFCCQSRR
jgi:conjugal transfer mating pair stabilization protein TraG